MLASLCIGNICWILILANYNACFVILNMTLASLCAGNITDIVM